MLYFLFKTLSTALVIAGVSEISKRYTFLASLLASLPLTTILIFFWIYVEQKDVSKIGVMSLEIFFLVIPSLVFFILLPVLFRSGLSFYLAIFVDGLITFVVYFSYIRVLRFFRPELGL